MRVCVGQWCRWEETAEVRSKGGEVGMCGIWREGVRMEEGGMKGWI